MTREQVAQALYTAEFGPKGFPGPNSKFWAMADAVLALSPPEPTEGQIEVLFAGLDDRLDRLCVNDTDGSRFILSGVSAHNITEIAKEWVRSSLRAMRLQAGAITQDKQGT